MDWAARRRFMISFIGGAVVVTLLSTISISLFYKTPTCSDGVKNQGEMGIDCGVPCAYLCTAEEQPPNILFTKTLYNNPTRVDVAALVENKNANAAAKNVRYHITLYAEGQPIKQGMDGTIDIPPRGRVPVYVPVSVSDARSVTSAFLTIDSSVIKWYLAPSDLRIIPTVVRTSVGDSVNATRVDAVLANPSITPLSNIRVIIFVYDANENIIAASQTIVPSLLSQGQATATFTWGNSFKNPPATFEVTPLTPLP